MKLNDKDFFSDDLRSTHWLGEVTVNEDPENRGRLKVKVFGKFDQLEDDNIPWAYPGNNFTAGSASGSGFFSVPKVGSIVNVYFDNGNIYHPVYTFHQKPSDELIEEIGDDHQNFHSLIYDSEIEGSLKIFYSANSEKGLFINLKDTLINIKNDNEIIIKNPNGDIISLVNDGILNITTNSEVNINTPTANINADAVNLGKNATQSLIKGEAFKQVFDNHMHTGNLGAVTSPPITPIPPDNLSNVSKTE